MKILYRIVLLILVSFNAYAYKECTRPVQDVFMGLNSFNVLWVTFSDGGTAVYINETDITAGQMSRLFSAVLTAQTTGKQLIVRYADSGLTCPTSGSARNDIEAVWLKNN